MLSSLEMASLATERYDFDEACGVADVWTGCHIQEPEWFL